MALCRTCQKDFEINDADKAFYAKVGIPLPTLCPNDRHKRRLNWRDDRTFYRAKSAKSGKELISMYPADTPYVIYHSDEWWKDDWDPMDFGRDFDFGRPFFEQFAQLQRVVPRMNLDLVNCENSDFCNFCGDDKNCYFDIAGEANEDCYYNLFVKYSKDCVDCTFAYHSTLCYECIHCHNTYNNTFCMYCDDSSDCLFSYDLKGCKNCLFSYNLRNKEYHIYNKPYSKVEYTNYLNSLNLGSYQQFQNITNAWTDYRKKNALHRESYFSNCENCTGNDLKNCKNCRSCFNATNSEDCKFLYDVLDAKDCYDLNYSLYNPEVACELISTLQMKYSAFNMASHFCDNVFYCDMVNYSSNLFGCIGLRRKQYCILNKQYTKEEYESLKKKIIEHMQRTGEWGEFFPASISPWAYNETVAQEYFPLTKEQTLAQGFRWEEKDPREYQPQTYAVPNNIKDAPDSIVNEVLACASCGKNFRIIKQELSFYKKRGLPVPRICNECRHYQRVALRNPRQLFEKACAQCGAHITTTCAENRPEQTYCEKCYLAAVY